MKTAMIAVAVLAALSTTARQEAREAGFEPTDEMMRAMEPGPMHAKLEPLIGSFEMAGQWRPTPDAPWDEFEGTVEREWVLDGHFVQEDVESVWLDQPFTGRGLIGHDNVRGEYTMVWVDNRSTAIHATAGALNDAGQIVLEGENSDPMSGQEAAWSRSVLDLSRPDEHTVEMWAHDEDGEPFVSMQMTLTRS